MTIDTSTIVKGIIAGFAATVVLTLLMMLKKMMGVMPELDPVRMLAEMAAQRTGMELNLMVGWVMHFVIGSIAWGSALVLLNDILPGNTQVMKGIGVGIAAWLLMMVGPLPMSGSGLFGLNIGIMVPVMTLVFHLVFGVVLGLVFKALGGTETTT